MKNYLYMLLCFLFLPLHSADNEIFLDQSGTGANIDLEQLGISNIIGGLSSSAGNLTAFDLDGTGMTLDINMIGATNKFLGDIWADSFTGIYNFTGSTNTFTIQVDPSNTYGADSSNQNVAVTGAGNTFTLNQATSALAATLDLDWIIQGSDNTVTYTGTGVTASAGGYFYLDHTGGSRSFNIQQLSTQDNDWLKIISVGGNSSSTVCVIQNDQGTAVGC